MKNVLTICVLALLFTATACDKDDDMNCDNLSDVIVGKWDVENVTTGVGSEVEFKGDGTLVDQQDFLISGEVNGDTLNMKSYTIEGDTLVNFRAEGATGQSVEFGLPVTSFNCDEMTMEEMNIGIRVNFDKK